MRAKKGKRLSQKWKKETKILRKNQMNWELLAKRHVYKHATLVESSQHATSELEKELIDDTGLTLKGENNEKSYAYKKRLLRRIVEKKQAQALHRKVKRTNTRFCNHTTRHNAKESFNDIYYSK